MQTLVGRTCVFAGATAGDGVAAVKALCAGGMNVVMVTHQAQRAAALVEEINLMGLPGKCEAIGVTTEGPAEESARVYEDLEKKYGSVDVIISNTGDTGSDTAMEELESEELLEETSHLLGGAFRMMKAALPYIRKSKAPRIIFMSSVEGIHGGCCGSFSNAIAKGAVNSLAVNVAARLAKEKICVNCIAKGAIPRVEGISVGRADPEAFLPYIPMGRLGTADDLAQLICFLASEEASYITGQTICLDGGLGIGR